MCPPRLDPFRLVDALALPPPFLSDSAALLLSLLRACPYHITSLPPRAQVSGPGCCRKRKEEICSYRRLPFSYLVPEQNFRLLLCFPLVASSLPAAAAARARPADRRATSREADTAATNVAGFEHGRVPLPRFVSILGSWRVERDRETERRQRGEGRRYRNMSGTMKKRTWLPRM